ncbi:MAG: efflux RND transporter periplasmic adaptor subunit [Planctomycetota bacterium]
MKDPKHTGAASAWLLLVVVVAVASLAAGFYWHESLGQLLGKNASVTDDSSAGANTQVYTCGMHPNVLQNGPGTCPICHMALTPLADASSAAAGTTDRQVRYWWDPTSTPPFVSRFPGKSPMGIELAPVYAEDITRGAAVTIDAAVVQNMGVRVELVSEGPLRRTLRLSGSVLEAESLVTDINLLVSGWIRKLHANVEGMAITAGAPLFEIYSPELQIAVEELIAARRARGALTPEADAAARQTTSVLYDATRRKLELWGLARRQIEELAQLDRAPETILFLSPVSGDLVLKEVVTGAAVKAGDRVLRIVDHSVVWIDAQVFEQQLSFVTIGQRARATTVAFPGVEFSGACIFLHPHVNPTLRTTIARFEFDNTERRLRPGMYATMTLEVELEPRAVLAPREAVIDTGREQMAFVALGVGRFEPRRLRVGLADDAGRVQILAGLAPGEPVVVSGQFLLDSESRHREAISKFLNDKRTPAPPVDGELSARDTLSADDLRRLRPTVDQFWAAYLDFAARLGAPQSADQPLAAQSVMERAEALARALASTPFASLGVAIERAARALQSVAIAKQREVFKSLSDDAIRLADLAAPSRSVAGALHVMYCSMAPGRWLQRGEEIANPYYATAMKECGELERRIATVPSADEESDKR